MRIVLLALLLASVSALRAQGQQPTLQGLPEYGVLLIGSPEVPVIVNHSGRAIIGFDLRTYDADGGMGPGAGLVLVYLRSAAIMVVLNINLRSREVDYQSLKRFSIAYSLTTANMLE